MARFVYNSAMNKQMDIKIKNEDAIIKIWKVISWLDRQRWNPENLRNYVNFFQEDLSSCEKVLTHWVCYITDRQMPFELIWDKGGYVFSEMVHEYSISQLPLQEILDNHYEKYYDNAGREHYRFRTSNDVTFSSRYVTDDYQAINQTLEVLDHPTYKRNIVAYIVEVLRKFKSEHDLLLRVACALHLLTYQLDRKKANPEIAIKVLNDGREFHKKLIRFKRTSTSDKKRLWCSVRDYKKGLYQQIFNQAIEEVAADGAEELIDLWNNLPMDQIELPGDVWNNSPLFRDNMFPSVLDISGIPKSWGMPKIIRELYNQLKNKEEINNFYPEQFDVTFDFAPRMCSKKLCDVCPFGPDGVESICIPSPNKYCPVALLSCGYITRCIGNQSECVLKEGVGKGICKGALR